MYVDDIVFIGNDTHGIDELKQFLQQHFQTKDLGTLKYFLGIEVAQSKWEISLSQRKYVLDMLDETGLLGSKPVETPMDPNVKMTDSQGEPLEDPTRYQRLVGS
ncbi:PREDICTED: uncharacterized protein LOC109114067 [Nelumbo nucifera]|uniref:Uncharacterized protein LOC109114067 n=1 Tax=Nelumbo nucifera TaxID=4432 RepID=A0A1U8PYQ8_NELNU|nr:PREDICTED: uncharacterized protein LOC109114067 [Nelumbo nucifera]